MLPILKSAAIKGHQVEIKNTLSKNANKSSMANSQGFIFSPKINTKVIMT